MPLFLIRKHLGKFIYSIFIMIIATSNGILSKCSCFYQDISIKWINNYNSKPAVTSIILSEFTSLKWNVKVGNKFLYFSFFFDKKLNFICQLLDTNGNVKSWDKMKVALHLKNTRKIYWLQIIDVNYRKHGRTLVWITKGM